MQKNAGVKGNTQAPSMNKRVNAYLKRAEPQSMVGDGDICAPIVKSSPFSKNCERRRDDELRGGPHVGMGKAKISSDSRTQDLISDKNPRLDHHRDRMDEHGGQVYDTDWTKGRQGNTMAQPSDKKSKFNRDNQVANPDDSI